jgi:hypothetical protein
LHLKRIALDENMMRLQNDDEIGSALIDIYDDLGYNVDETLCNLDRIHSKKGIKFVPEDFRARGCVSGMKPIS